MSDDTTPSTDPILPESYFNTPITSPDGYDAPEEEPKEEEPDA